MSPAVADVSITSAILGLIIGLIQATYDLRRYAKESGRNLCHFANTRPLHVLAYTTQVGSAICSLVYAVALFLSPDLEALLRSPHSEGLSRSPDAEALPHWQAPFHRLQVALQCALLSRVYWDVRINWFSLLIDRRLMSHRL